MASDFEIQITQNLRQFLVSKGEIDAHFPECPDVEAKWDAIVKSYLSDGIREFGLYPVASLGWVMYIGMAMAKYWDADWEIYSNIEDIYAFMRNKRGYDNLDDYIVEEVLQLRDSDEVHALDNLVRQCASLLENALRHRDIEPGTVEAFRAYVACLHLMYLAGMAVQLHRMGYRMAQLN